ncbi:hypothetical protein GJ654_03270 [Rhodoblastus acidophilus]|uniref:Uncharacterized protein n=1 Tax=Rhodoblastus acidophilus TaxID=1074 RepID=A0A6N8DHV9_RHOAC|nr:hypothetical protein [Rhodoblastus acidophilus]MCW2273113.1 hypothetical protein [Rhodoblastus acidophilus]MTV30010.1 hypothetical protein [Rhodoblastus acidophilus]
MPPADADFGFVIDFKKGSGNPRRVFDAASALIDAFESFDKAISVSVDSKIEPLMLLEDVESGSLKVWLKNILSRVDDAALKDLDWKKQVGHYLVKAKYLALEYLDDDKSARPRLEDLKSAMLRMAKDTDIQHLPTYAPVHEGRLLASLDKIQKAKSELEYGDRLYIDLDDKEFEVDINSTWIPSDAVAGVEMDSVEKHNDVEMILKIRKPDLIKDTMWQFSYGRNNISAAIKDESWLIDFHSRKIPIFPGDALECIVRVTSFYSEDGKLTEQKMEVIKVLSVIPGQGPQAQFAF